MAAVVTSTDLFIDNFNAENAAFSLTEWLHDHPEDVKIAQIAALVFGALLLATLPLSLSVSVALGIGLGTLGALSLLASIVSWIFLNYITCARHDPNEHVFEAQADGAGRLYYSGNVPILELSGTDRENGRAHGYLLGRHIHALYGKMELAIHTILRQPRAGSLPNTLAEIRERVPENYLEELEGLAEGFNRWAEDAGVSRRFSADDFLLIHLLPDSKHFHTHAIEKGLTTEEPAGQRTGANLSLACTTILHRDEEQGLIFGRNMDWCPFGEGGENSLLVVWKKRDYERGVAALSIPGLIGVITGWNQQRTCLAMNVCPGETDKIAGIPSIFYNRMMLDLYQNVQEIDAERQRPRSRPLGPYHMTIADAGGNGACFSFYQAEDGQDHVRRAENEPLIALNWRYPQCEGGFFNSQTRCEILTRYFHNASLQMEDGLIDVRKLIENALQLSPYVNSYITMHSLIFLPEQNEVALSWDNGYAASMPRQRLRMSEVFN